MLPPAPPAVTRPADPDPDPLGRAEVQVACDLADLLSEYAEMGGPADHATRAGGLAGFYARAARGMMTAVSLTLKGLVGQMRAQARCCPSPARHGHRTYGQSLRWLADRIDRLDHAAGLRVEGDDGRPLPPESLYPFLAAGGDGGDGAGVPCAAGDDDADPPHILGGDR